MDPKSLLLNEGAERTTIPSGPRGLCHQALLQGLLGNVILSGPGACEVGCWRKGTHAFPWPGCGCSQRD